MAAGASQLVEHLLALAVVDAARKHRTMALQNTIYRQQKRGDFFRQVHLGFFQRAENFLAEGQETAKVTKCDHGNAVAHQGIVGVVPFRPLGVQPNARLRNEVGELGEQHDKKFFAQIDEAHLALPVPNELAIGAFRMHTPAHHLFLFLIENHRFLGILEQVCIGLDPVRNIGEGKDFTRQKVMQSGGFMPLQNFQQLEQIDDLVIAPVTNMGPGIGGINDLPINAVAGDAIGIVAIGGGGIGELANHARRVAGEGKREGFPILEDVAPVALVIQNPRPVPDFSWRWKNDSRDDSDRRAAG